MPENPRILIVRPSALGDVARTVPALVSLKRAFPAAQIDWLVNDAFVDCIANHPDLHAAVPFPRKRLSRFGFNPSATREGLRYFADLRRRRYDIVFDLQGLGRSGWLTRVTGAPRRIGPADARELGWLGYNRRVRIDPTIVHTVDRMLAVLESQGIEVVRDMRLYTPPDDANWADQWIRSNGITHERFAVIAPTAAWASKRWPVERFGPLIEALGAEGIVACVIVGAESERPQTRPLLADTGNEATRRIDLVGQTSVGHLMAIIERAALVVANDSAALHLAIGLGRRCVGIFGPTDPAKVGPYRYDTGVVAAEHAGQLNYRTVDERNSAIAQVSVERVLEQVRTAMRSPPPVTHG